MNLIQKYIQILAETGKNEGEICFVRSVNGIYIDCEKINTLEFNEATQNTGNTYYNVRLTLDQEGVLSYEKPQIKSRVLVIQTEDGVRVAIQANQIADVIYNVENFTAGLKNIQMTISGTTQITAKQDITLKDTGSIDIEATQKITEKANGISIDAQAGQMTLKNSAVNITDLFNDIIQVLTAINGVPPISTSVGPANATLIADLVTKLNLLF